MHHVMESEVNDFTKFSTTSHSNTVWNMDNASIDEIVDALFLNSDTSHTKNLSTTKLVYHHPDHSNRIRLLRKNGRYIDLTFLTWGMKAWV